MTDVWRAETLPAWGPSPDGTPVTLLVRCSTAPGAHARADRHEVVLHPDWTVTTPHDLDAERVAAALGGYLSCLDLVDRVVPAAREAAQAQGRRVLPPLARTDSGSWRVRTGRSVCCRAATTADVVAQHVRSVRHVATRHRAVAADVQVVLAAVLAAHGCRGSVPLPADEAALAAHCVRGRGALDRLWAAGVHPVHVRAVHTHLVGSAAAPLPWVVVLAATTGREGLAWVAQTVADLAALSPDPDEEALATLADWLTWSTTPWDDEQRAACVAWLHRGVPPRWVGPLLEGGYRAEDGAALARATRRSAVGAASVLLAWLRAGCRPSVAQLVALQRSGVPAWFEPSPASVARLHDQVRRRVPDVTATELGLLLAREGTVTAAERVVLQRRPGRDEGAA